jgi:predicted HNH restriction endonuclease
MQPDWGTLFEHFGVKIVRPTDKAKSAYVLSTEQVEALTAAGLTPSRVRPGVPFDVSLLFDTAASVQASYYHSQRSGSGRDPEPRLGRAIISKWLEVGDTVIIGNVGSQLFAAKIRDQWPRDAEVAAAIASASNAKGRREILRKAKRAKGRPGRKLVTRTEFDRNPWVVMAALLRADGECETPGCSRPLFTRDDGNPYLEVHHIVPLGEGGEDTLENAAGLCPHCHRELHFGKRRAALRKTLAAHIRTKPI